LIPDAQFQRIIRLLRADVSATSVRDCDDLIQQEATQARVLVHTATFYEDKVVERVQQRLHDEFIDTTWPACPEHANHPLWLVDGWWRCDVSGTAVAELGRLPRRR
jgi:hypothetical protein